MSSRRRRAVLVIAGTLLMGWGCASARGDGGTLRLRQRAGVYDVAVFTAPTPFRAGPVDISVLVQDASTGEPVPEAGVAVRLAPCGRPGAWVAHDATTEAATNKLLRAALFDLPRPGCWEVEVAIGGPRGEARCAFTLEAAGPSPGWLTLWPWFAWPALAVVLFGLHQFLAGERARVKPNSPSRPRA